MLSYTMPPCFWITFDSRQGKFRAPAPRPCLYGVSLSPPPIPCRPSLTGTCRVSYLIISFLSHGRLHFPFALDWGYRWYNGPGQGFLIDVGWCYCFPSLWDIYPVHCVMWLSSFWGLSTYLKITLSLGVCV